MLKQSLINAIDNFFETEKHRLINLVPVGIGIGICAYFALNNEPSIFFGGGVFSFALATFIFYKSYKIRTKIESSTGDYIANFLLSGTLCIAFGFFIAQIRTKCVDTFMLTVDLKRPISFAATIESCEKTEKGLKFIVSNIERKYNDQIKKQGENFNKLHLIWIGKKARDAFLDYVPGSKVLFRAILSPIRSSAFPNAYDFKKQQYFKGISARGFIVKPPKIIQKYERATLSTYIERIRHNIDKTIEKYLPKNAGAIAKALTTGNTAGITKQIRSNFSNSGIAHILAISGLHIGIIGFFVFFLTRVFLCCIFPISMFYNTKKAAAVLSWTATLFYLQISGCSVSSIRAFIMHMIVMLAILLNRTALTMRSVAIAATIIMIRSPEAIMFPSFQMSFGAVIAIIAYVESGFKTPKFLKWLSEAIITTIAASVPTAIISISVFNQLTLNSVLANIASIPLMAFYIMPMLMISLLLMPFDLSQTTILLAKFGIELLMKITEETSKLPGSCFVMATPAKAVFGVIVASFLIFTLIHHKIRFAGLFGMFCGCVAYFFQPIPDIFIAPHAKTIGILTKEAVCFSHMGYFRSMIRGWSRSVGFATPNNFKAKACQKYISQINDDTYETHIKNKKIIVTKNNGLNASDTIFVLNKGTNEKAEVIYLDNMKRISTENLKRPWS